MRFSDLFDPEVLSLNILLGWHAGGSPGKPRRRAVSDEACGCPREHRDAAQRTRRPWASRFLEGGVSPSLRHLGCEAFPVFGSVRPTRLGAAALLSEVIFAG